MLSSPYILLFATFGVAIAEPVKLELRDSPAAATTDAEEGFPWVIPEMSLRFHTEYTGFKGPWPVDTKFEDSSIHFKVYCPFVLFLRVFLGFWLTTTSTDPLPRRLSGM
jgi:hypothetical protein